MIPIFDVLLLVLLVPAGLVLKAFSRMRKKSASGVLTSLRVLLYGPEYDSPLCSLRPCWTAFLRIPLEALLTHNQEWRVIGVLNYLKHHRYNELKAVCPYLSGPHEPGSFYLQRT
jgi:hypothetical protein